MAQPHARSYLRLGALRLALTLSLVLGHFYILKRTERRSGGKGGAAREHMVVWLLFFCFFSVAGASFASAPATAPKPVTTGRDQDNS